ncbi:hypothetical protein NQ317_006104 [Molorchus minor]|uniref:E3 ubiquitin-protein ligase RNF10 n=1 Tax=Molorchus minor TaxID=1323400 RepID=A0ABQ9IQV9_9CUCU|nr:hypothetical protein NQ317_006104 [Molorchus minor]
MSTPKSCIATPCGGAYNSKNQLEDVGMEKKESQFACPQGQYFLTPKKMVSVVGSGPVEAAAVNLIMAAFPQNPNLRVNPNRSSKTIDKRPKHRGGYFGNPVARDEAPQLEEHQVELGSVYKSGTKKQNLNHLLNFSFADTPSSGFHLERSKSGGGNRMLATKKHRYNKEHFLQATCQFIVNDSGDYKQYLNNPDALVDWNLIEQVRCGHIYCWSCVLHYLSFSDKLCRKCPLCDENVQVQDLKSVVPIFHSSLNVTETITFKLMKRQKGCLIAYPADAEVKTITSYLILLKRKQPSNKDVLSIIEREHAELQTQNCMEDDSIAKCFVEQAIVLLKEREVRVRGKVPKANDTLEVDRSSDPEDKQVFCEGKDNILLENTDAAVNDADNAGSLVALLQNLDISESSTSQPSKFQYFYQASDGQHIYLNSLNARMLEHTYGSLENSPRSILGVILEKESGSMTEDLRRKFRYLQHLPLTCHFEIVEIQLNEPIVTKDTLQHFHDKIGERRRKRQRKAKEEKRREKLIEAEENRKMGKFPVPNLHLESNIQFPEFGGEPRLRTDSEDTQSSERSPSPKLCSLSSSFSESSVCSGPSFATMLATEKKQPLWPNLKPTSSVSGPQKLINVTGPKMNAATSIRTRRGSDIEMDPEEYEPVPDFTRSFGDAIAQAMQQVEEQITSSPVLPESGKKKKKNKQKVLFSTGMAYSGN